MNEKNTKNEPILDSRPSRQHEVDIITTGLENKDDIKMKTRKVARPHRCDSRFEDFIQSFGHDWGTGKSFQMFKLFWKCILSKPGEEPRDPHTYLNEDQLNFYVEKRREFEQKNFENREK